VTRAKKYFCAVPVVAAAMFGGSLLAHAAPDTSVVVTTLYSYTGASGAGPDGGMIIDPSGVLYGVTYGGGAMNQGAVYQLVPPATAGGAWTENTLYSFTGGNDGGTPFGALSLDAQGNVYGSTIYGGASNSGTVFELIRPATTGAAWTEIVLYSFAGLTDGGNPNGSLIFNPTGRLYGTAPNGGSASSGVIFQLSPPSTTGAPWTYSVLYNFQGGSSGATPSTGVIFGLGNALYGCTYAGGTSNAGTVYQLTPPPSGTGPWTQSVLYSFTGGKDGGYPDSGLITGVAGALYGVTPYGGTGYGTVYQITPPQTGSTWTESALYDFKGTPAKDGENPYGSLLLISHDVLLGTTYGGGSGNGTLYSLAPPTQTGGAWTETILYEFTKSTNGSNPYAGVVAGPGNLVFGTTFYGGKKHQGVVFSATP